MQKSLIKQFINGTSVHRSILAADNESGIDILSVLIHDEDNGVRYACCNNPNITFDIVKSNIANLKFDWIKYSALSEADKESLKDIFENYKELFQ